MYVAVPGWVRCWIRVVVGTAVGGGSKVDVLVAAAGSVAGTVSRGELTACEVGGDPHAWTVRQSNKAIPKRVVI